MGAKNLHIKIQKEMKWLHFCSTLRHIIERIQPALINLCLSFLCISIPPLHLSLYSRHCHGVGSTSVILNLQPLSSQTQTQRTIIMAPCHSLCSICLHFFSLLLGLIINTLDLWCKTINYPGPFWYINTMTNSHSQSIGCYTLRNVLTFGGKYIMSCCTSKCMIMVLNWYRNKQSNKCTKQIYGLIRGCSFILLYTFSHTANYIINAADE